MTTEPTDLREKIARALWDALDHVDDIPFEDHPARYWCYRDADAVLPIVREAVAEARAETWSDGYATGWADSVNAHALRQVVDYGGADITPNTYEESTDDES